MPENTGGNDSVKRRLLLRVLGLLGGTAFAGTASARSQKDERAGIDRTFTELLNEHGQPTIAGRKRFANGEVIESGNAPENAAELFSNKRYDVVGAMKYAFEDGVRKTVAIGTNQGENLMVYVDGRYFVTTITDADRRALASRRKQLKSKMKEQIQSALQERYQSDEYRRAAQ